MLFCKSRDVSNLKLRGGWGRVGNQNIDNDATLTLLGQSDYVFGTTPGRVSGTMVSDGEDILFLIEHIRRFLLEILKGHV